MSFASRLRRSTAACLPVLALLALAPAAPGQANRPSVLDGYDPNVDGIVYAVALQPDGKAVVAGKFTSFQPSRITASVTRNNIARIEFDGTLDSFDPNANGQVNAVALQSDGRILIGGAFTSVGGVSRTGIARLNANGTLDTSFAASVGGALTLAVNAIAVQQDGKIVLGGSFTTIGPTGGTLVTRNRIARLNADGTLDTTFNVSLNQPVHALAVQPDGNILVGGAFATAQVGSGAVVARSRLLRLAPDGSIDASFDPAPDATVSVIALQPDARILIGGYFGNFTPNGASTSIHRGRLARLNVDGTIDTTFRNTEPSPSGRGPDNVVALAVQADGKILVGGYFGVISGAQASYAARLFPDGDVDLNFNPGVNYAVHAFAVQPDGGIILGGNFVQLRPFGAVVPLTRNHLARVNISGNPDSTFFPNAGGRITGFAVQPDGKTVVVGTFSSIAGVARRNIARVNVDGSLDIGFDPKADGGINAVLIQPNGKIIIGGDFRNVAGVARNFVARINPDGTLDTVFDPNADSTVNAFALQSDGKILIGGSFQSLLPNKVKEEDTTDIVTGLRIARLNDDGTLDNTFGPFVNGVVEAIEVLPDGRILLGGSFFALQADVSLFPTPQFNYVRLSSTGVVDFRHSVTPTAPPPLSGAVQAIEVQPDGKVLLGGGFSILTIDEVSVARNRVARINEDGTLDAFDPNINGNVFRLALQPDGKVIVAGAFVSASPNGATTPTAINHVARFNADGTLDTSFNVRVNGAVTALHLLPDGRILIGGSFTELHPVGAAAPSSRNRIARINADGSLDNAFDPNFGSASSRQVNAVAIEAAGQILIGGDLTDLAGAPVANLGRFFPDGRPDFNFLPALNGPVNAIAVRPSSATNLSPIPGFTWLTPTGGLRPSFRPAADAITGSIRGIARQPDGSFIIVGSFTHASGLVGPNIARFRADGTLDTSFAPKPDNVINTISLHSDGRIIIGGSFTKINGTTRNRLARLNADGTLDASWDPNPNSDVFAVQALPDGRVMVSGSFVTMNPNGATTASSAHQFTIVKADGTVDTTFDANTDGIVSSFALQADGKVLLGGTFSGLQPRFQGNFFGRPGIARLNTDGTVDPDFGVAINGAVGVVVVQPDGKIVVGGDFTSVGELERQRMVRLNADGTVDTGFAPSFNGTVNAAAVLPDGRILVGGTFTNVSGLARNNLAILRADGTVDPDFDPNLNAGVEAIALVPDGSLLIGGSFTEVVVTGQVYAGGNFTAAGASTASNLVLLNASGSASPDFRPNPNGVVNALVLLPDGRLVVGGAFTQIGGAARNRLARFNADGTLDTGFNPGADGEVFALALLPDGRIAVGGAFSTVGGAPRARLAVIETNGSVSGGSNLNIDGTVLTIAAGDGGRLTFGGDFTSVNGVPRNRIARMALSGVDASFNPNANGTVNSIVLQANGQALVGGAFTAIGGATRNHAARLNVDGTADATFDPNPDGSVLTIAIQPDGKTLLGGRFSRVGGQPRFRFTRLAAATPASQSITLAADYRSIVWSRSGSLPVLNWATFEYSTDKGLNWTSIGTGHGLITIDGNSVGSWEVEATSLPEENFVIRARGAMPSGQFASSGLTEWSHFIHPRPEMTSATSASAAVGSSFFYAVAATNEPTRYSATGLPPGLSINPTTGVISGTPLATGTYAVTIRISNASGSRNWPLILTVGAPGSILPSTGAELINTSTRASVTPGRPIILGFVLGGTSAKTVLLRGAGPSLTPMGVPGVLARPHLMLFNGQGSLLSDSDGWDGSADTISATQSAGAFPFPAGSADAAIVATLSPGPYTLHVTGPTGSGIALAETYGVFAGEPGRFINFSARGPTAPANPLIAGFVVGGTTGNRRMLVRALGSGLTARGVTDAVPDVVMRIFNSAGVLVAENNNWGTNTNAAEIATVTASVGAVALASGGTDAALLVTLAPGAYTVQVSDAANASGSAMAELFEVP